MKFYTKSHAQGKKGFNQDQDEKYRIRGKNKFGAEHTRKKGKNGKVKKKVGEWV